MKKIVLPTDFSENAYNAISYALNLYKNEECAFYLLNTFNPSIYYDRNALQDIRQMDLGDVNQTNSLKQLHELQDDLLKKFKNPKHVFVPHSVFGTLVDEIKKIVEKEKISLVIMGTQGATGAKEVLFGTHAIHVIKKIKCPVIAVPSGFIYEAPKNILFPTNYEINYRKELFMELLHIADQHASLINVLHVGKSHDFNESQLAHKSVLKEVLGSNHLFHDVPDNKIIPAINDFQLKNDIDLLAMIRNKHNFMERLFIEPVIKKIGFHIAIPFMVIPYRDRD